MAETRTWSSATAHELIDLTRIDASAPSPWTLEQFRVPKGRYLDREFLALERERLFPRTWILACREEEVLERGEYVEVALDGEPLLVVRGRDDTIRCLKNACRHRGTRLARGRGRVGNLRCPFHGWQYGLDGSSQYVHDADDFTAVSASDLCLPGVRTESWGGFVFVNLDGMAPPLQEYLAPLPETLRVFDVADMRYTWHKSFPLPCNWKIALEAFSESYHVPGTHPQLLRPLSHSKNPASRRELESDPSFAPSSVLGLNVAKFSVEPRDPSNPRYNDRKAHAGVTAYHIEELRALHTQRDLRVALALAEDDTVADSGPEFAAAFRRGQREAALAEGLPWPELDPTSRRALEQNYCVFPNMVFLVRQGVLLGYSARPLGDDPNACSFEVFALELVPPGANPTIEHETYSEWRAGDVGGVLEQDFENLEDVTAGMHSSAFQASYLSPVQEIAVFHRHVMIDKYLFGDSVA